MCADNLWAFHPREILRLLGDWACTGHLVTARHPPSSVVAFPAPGARAESPQRASDSDQGAQNSRLLESHYHDSRPRWALSLSPGVAWELEIPNEPAARLGASARLGKLVKWLCPPALSIPGPSHCHRHSPLRNSLTHLFVTLNPFSRPSFVPGTQEHQGEALASNSSWSSSEGR